MKKMLAAVLSLLLACAGVASAEDMSSWLTIGGDYRFRYDYLKGTVQPYYDAGFFSGKPGPVAGFTVENTALMTNRFGLNIRADAMEDVTVKARLEMYKIWGHETSGPIQGDFAADRAFGVNDATIGHVPYDNALLADYVYATVSNIFGAPAWFSVGRRPSTGGIPSNLRQNLEKVGTAGIPSLMVDYAFDGMTLGYAPDVDALPGMYAKLCYGKGYDSGYQPTTGTTLKDTDFFGVDAVILDTELVHVELQYQMGRNIFDAPSDGFTMVDPVTGALTPVSVTENLGDISWVGGVVTGKIGNLNLFASAAESKTDPNNNTFGNNMSPWGLLWTAASAGGEGPVKATGYAYYIGARYDMNRTKIGAEYNYGSKNWIALVPADDDIWTGKLGTRGGVYEVYIIQELNRKPITKRAKAFVRLGYQYYKFNYTGSNFWVGAPVSMPMAAVVPQPLAPLSDAQDLYLTFDVLF
jgi:hypothetical protein